MAALDSTLRRQLERTVVNARTTAENAADKALRRLGMHHHEPPSTLSPEERTFRRELEAQKSQLADYQALVEQCAYEHWHRILFARFLAENELLIHPTAGVAVSLEDCDDAELQANFGASDAYDLAARYAAQMLPAVFRPDDALLRVKLAPEDRIALEKLVKELPETVFEADDSLGWTYQFWQSQRKKEVNEAEQAVEGSDISAVTQLFTEHYMVRFLLENTIGAWWVHHKPKTSLNSGWEFYKSEVPHDFSAFPATLEEVTFLDPCCGSGHFLVEAFLLFQSMYREQGLNAAEAGNAAIENNIRGLELDPRCTQIAAFNVALAAWRVGGFRRLPEVQIACSGLPLKGSRSQWENLARGDTVLTAGMAMLHETFSNAADLGSLIRPPAVVEAPAYRPDREQAAISGLEEEIQRSITLSSQATWEQLQPLLIEAARQETKDTIALHAGIRAQGVAKAAQLLSDKYWFVETNPPFLLLSKMNHVVQRFVATHFSDTKKDLCMTFVDRCAMFTHDGGEFALVNPQNWLFLKVDLEFRVRMLTSFRWNAFLSLGNSSFQTPVLPVICLLAFTKSKPSTNTQFFAGDVSDGASPAEIQERLALAEVAGSRLMSQVGQLQNPNSIVATAELSTGPQLRRFATALMGCSAGDGPRFIRSLWEVGSVGLDWEFHQTTVNRTGPYFGKDEVIFWQKECGLMAELAASVRHLNHAAQNWLRGKPNWGKCGVAVSQMSLESTLYQGNIYDCNCCAIVPNAQSDLPALWAYCSSGEFASQVRKLNKTLKVSPGSLLDVPFERDHWHAVATSMYPNGLPEPHSDDPTQWLFRGDIPSSTDPLQVSVARLLGYRWPDQPEGPLDRHADEDGLVTLAPLVNQDSIAGRLRALLQAAYESEAPARPKGAPEPKEPRIWNENVIPNLLVRAGSSGMSLEDWLRDKFFEAHTKLFQQRPFIWHIWDGRKDGFHTYVNYHKLDRKNLERLTHVYLGEWIERQRAASESGDRTADARLIAAQELQRKLELIRTGEPPYDIFVRWKSLAEQPLGWDPDLNDGVRMNIRPFVEAGILRGRVNVNWNKDRGKDPKPNVSGTVERHNDLHFTLSEKRAAREAKG